MYAGRIVERATVDDIFANPVHPYTEALLRAIPRPGNGGRRRLLEIGGSPPDLAHLPSGCPFEPRCFLGHGDERCAQQTPPAVTVTNGTAEAVAECHYAADRSVQTRVGSIA
jgi:oligopeptide/dipeptide ABC transporter ATP-binding protein